MKRLFAVFLSVVLLALLSACQFEAQPTAAAPTRPYHSTASSRSLLSSTTQSTAASSGVTTAADTALPDTSMQIDTAYYTVTVPGTWKTDCLYDIVARDGDGYSLMFCHRPSLEAGDGGWLFSLELLPATEDYTQYPAYTLLGRVTIPAAGSYHLVVTYPADVQYSDTTAAGYGTRYHEISAVLKTIAFKKDGVFSPASL